MLAPVGTRIYRRVGTRAGLLPPAAAPLATVVSARIPRKLVIESLVPVPMERFPWAGHMGMRLLPQVLGVLEAARDHPRHEVAVGLRRMLRGAQLQ